ncbi:MAG: glycosyltransferase [Balneolaceae bacterium]|nr:glycosyltransferase [Balneolaceae bacterium]
MTDTIQLSIILTTHAREKHFSSLLNSILAFEHGKFELIVIDDASDPVTSQAIQKKIAASDNDRVYLFEHEESKGRGACLNEALVQASGTLVWAPLRADRLNESLLKEAIRRFKADPAAFWVLDYKLPEDAVDWIHAAEEGDLPDDSCLVWNRNVIHPEQLFFNPFLDQLHGAELAFRLIESNVWYTTDPFFVVADDQCIHPSHIDTQEFLYTALRLNNESEVRKALLDELLDSESRLKKQTSDDEYLIQSRRLIQQGDAKRALEMINKFLKRNPEHHEGSRIKITALEKLRRHVEAAELKHSLQRKPKEPEEQVDLSLIPEKDESAGDTEQPKSIEHSVVIPTTGHGKEPLELALLHLEKAVDPNSTELIVIDNASIDDTFDYLEQLQHENFLNITVITNTANEGFAKSVNRGIESAKGEYILVMHNDVQLSKNSVDLLKRGFKKSDKTAVTAPVLNTTKVEAQKKELSVDESWPTTERVDSCCFMIKKDLPVRFDEEYQLCYFEMDDFCRQITENGLELIVVRDTVVEHQRGTTIKLMGLELNPELKWMNRERFYKKWGSDRPAELPEEGTHPERFQKLGAPDNPMNPSIEWVETVQDYLTNEVRTEILREEWSDDEFFTIILTLLIADERELLRTLEERIDEMKPDTSLLVLFIHYYFKKNIYSRCKHYMSLAEKNHPIFDLYRLKIFVADKEFGKAIPLLNEMLGEYPSSPELFYLAGDMYEKNDDQGEAKSFFAMASQLDPYRFKNQDSSFELKF